MCLMQLQCLKKCFYFTLSYARVVFFMTDRYGEMTLMDGLNYEKFNLYIFFSEYVKYYSRNIYAIADRWVSNIFRHSRVNSPKSVNE